MEKYLNDLEIAYANCLTESQLSRPAKNFEISKSVKLDG